MEQIQQITETEWGLHIIMNDGAIIDDDSILPVIKFILAKAKETGKNKVLIEEQTIIRQVSVVRLLEVAQTFQIEVTGLRLALIAPQLTDNKNSQAMETFSFNRGVYLQYFNDKDTALEWLLR